MNERTRQKRRNLSAATDAYLACGPWRSIPDAQGDLRRVAAEYGVTQKAILDHVAAKAQA